MLEWLLITREQREHSTPYLITTLMTFTFWSTEARWPREHRVGGGAGTRARRRTRRVRVCARRAYVALSLCLPACLPGCEPPKSGRVWRPLEPQAGDGASRRVPRSRGVTPCFNCVFRERKRLGLMIWLGAIARIRVRGSTSVLASSRDQSWRLF